MSASLLPTNRAGTRKIGRSARTTSVIGHDSQNMAARVTATPITLLTTDEKVSVKACWAPRTSLFKRDTSAPVWVRVKKAMGILWTCSNTRVRMSKMRPSPMRADTQRCHRDRTASKIANPAKRKASLMMMSAPLLPITSLMIAR